MAPSGVSTFRRLWATVRAALVADWRQNQAREANRLLGTSGSPFWAKDYFEHRVRDSAQEQRIVRYIEKNPVSSGLCATVEDWPWSSALMNRGYWQKPRLKSRVPLR